MDTDRYWEYYDDQSSADFSEVSYTDLTGKEVHVPAEEDLTSQVYELRRRFGMDSEIKVYAREAAVAQ